MSNILLRPELGSSPGRSPHGTILLLCHYSLESISTIYDSIRSLQKLSRFQIEVMNVWPVSLLDSAAPSTIDVNAYVGIAIHNTLSYSPSNLYKIDNLVQGGLSSFKGVKIVFRQDEHHQTNAFRDYILSAGIDIVLTCLSAGTVAKVYGEEAARTIHWISTLTAYLTQELYDLPFVPMADRAWDVSYRGSYQPLFCGRLGYEKWAIGDDVVNDPRTADLKLNISSLRQNLIPQSQWLAFLSQSRATLGAESGSNLFDFDGEVAQLCDAFSREHANEDQKSRGFYLEAKAKFLDRFEGNVDYGQIGPRHLEAAATRTLLILYEGRYSGLLKPHVHYFPLQRDLSNLADAVALLADFDRLEAITAAARDHLFDQPELWYASIVAKLDDAIERVRATKSAPSLSSTGKKTLILCNHHPKSDPRIGWIASLFEPLGDVCEVGTLSASPSDLPTVDHVGLGKMRVLLHRQQHNSAWKPRSRDGLASLDAGVAALVQLDAIANSSADEIKRLLGAHFATPLDIVRFKSRCRYFTDANASLLQAALQLGRSDYIVAADLETLPAAIALKALWHCPVIYDAHEHWPSSFPDMQQWESEWWGLIENGLVKLADVRLTVSPPLAEFMTAEYCVHFIATPNAVPISDFPNAVDNSAADARGDGTIVFLFLGGFGPERGLELLIDAWSWAPAGCILHLRGPINDYRDGLIDRARGNKTYDSKIVFLPPVDERDLIKAAAMADVGVIPYEPKSVNNRMCCPNKLSQYLAAGLPILANQTQFVTEIVRTHGLGLVVDFADTTALISAIDRMRDVTWRLEAARKSRKTFETSFNWERQSYAAREAIAGLAAHSTEANGGPFRYEALLADVSLRRAPITMTPRSALSRIWARLPLPVRAWVHAVIR